MKTCKHLQVHYTVDFLKNFVKLAGKHLQWSLVFSKVARLNPCFYRLTLVEKGRKGDKIEFYASSLTYFFLQEFYKTNSLEIITPVRAGKETNPNPPLKAIGMQIEKTLLNDCLSVSKVS